MTGRLGFEVGAMLAFGFLAAFAAGWAGFLCYALGFFLGGLLCKPAAP